MSDDPILRPARTLIVPTEKRPAQQRVEQLDSGLLRVRFDPDPRPHPDQVEVSAYTDDPNLTRPATEHYFADEFQPLADGRPGIQDASVRVEMSAGRKDGALVFGSGAPELGATTAFVAARAVKALAEDYLGRGVEWGDGEQLGLESFETSTDDLNAFYKYTERKISLGRATSSADPVFDDDSDFDPKDPSYDLALSPEVVAHECGHAVFDTLKPHTPSSLSRSDADIRSVNEGLADGMAFLHDLKHTEVVQRALTETKLDLTRPNALSELGDTLGPVFHPTGAAGPALRSLLNDRKREPGKQYECHDGAQIVGGALYDFFLSRFQAQRARGNAPFESVRLAGDAAGALFLSALKLTPDDGSMTLQDYARGLVSADEVLFQGRYREPLREVLGKRGLLSAAEVDQTVAKVEELRQSGLVVAPGLILDGDKEAATRLYPKLRDALKLGDAKLEISRVERDRYGLLRMVFFQPRAHKTAETSLPALADVYGKSDRDALLSQGALTVVFDARGRLCAVHDKRGSGADVLIEGVRGDGEPPAGSETSLPLVDWDGIEHRDSFGRRPAERNS